MYYAQIITNLGNYYVNKGNVIFNTRIIAIEKILFKKAVNGEFYYRILGADLEFVKKLYINDELIYECDE